jgi:hypothetical protein
MAESRERQIEAEVLKRDLEKLKEESPYKDICCMVNPNRVCSFCNAKVCTDHWDKIRVFKRKNYCERCMKLELLFGDVNAIGKR